MPANENTPLIATVQVGPPRQRYPHNIVRRFCTIALSSSLIAFLFFFLVKVVFLLPEHRHRHHGPDQDEWSWPGWKGRRVSYERLKEILLETPDSEKAAQWSEYYTSGPHLAGQNYSQVCTPRHPNVPTR